MNRVNAVIDIFQEGRQEEAFIKAHDLFNKNEPHAALLLGSLYEIKGKDDDSAFGRARYYYRESIKNECVVEAYLGLARLLYIGKGGDTDYSAAAELYREVVNNSENSVALLMLGILYEKGQGVEKNIDMAFNLYSKAERYGYVFAITRMAVIAHKRGRHIRGLALRVKAALLAYRISKKNKYDPRVRAFP